MFLLFITAAAVPVMYQVAAAENRSGAGWPLLTFLLILALNFASPLPNGVNASVNMLAAFMLIFMIKLTQD